MHQIQNERQAKILKALGTYKFLTYEQMIRLGIGKHSSNLSTEFKMLMERRKPLASKIPNRIITIPAKHFLTKYGKDFLVDTFDWNESQVKYLKKNPEKDTQDSKHRTTTIDCHIELNLCCQRDGVELLFCDAYFDMVGNNRMNRNLKSKTAILWNEKESIKADLVFILLTSKQKELYFLEIENGNDTKKAVEKCVNHGKAILLGSANKKYEFKSGYRTLWIFENKSTMTNTIKRLNENPFFKNLSEYFLFKTTDSIASENFFSNWQNVKAQKRKLFYT